jgi:hypothetical protein
MQIQAPVVRLTVRAHTEHAQRKLSAFLDENSLHRGLAEANKYLSVERFDKPYNDRALYPGWRSAWRRWAEAFRKVSACRKYRHHNKDDKLNNA